MRDYMILTANTSESLIQWSADSAQLGIKKWNLQTSSLGDMYYLLKLNNLFNSILIKELEIIRERWIALINCKELHSHSVGWILFFVEVLHVLLVVFDRGVMDMRRIKCVDTLYTVLVDVHVEIIEGKGGQQMQ